MLAIRYWGLVTAREIIHALLFWLWFHKRCHTAHKINKYSPLDVFSRLSLSSFPSLVFLLMGKAYSLLPWLFSFLLQSHNALELFTVYTNSHVYAHTFHNQHFTIMSLLPKFMWSRPSSQTVSRLHQAMSGHCCSLNTRLFLDHQLQINWHDLCIISKWAHCSGLHCDTWIIHFMRCSKCLFVLKNLTKLSSLSIKMTQRDLKDNT